MAAARVYDKLHAHLDPLVGFDGVQALLLRSARLTHGVNVDGSAVLREWLQAQDPVLAMEAAVALFGTLFALLTRFIGERLTSQILRSAWPTIEDTAPKETRSER